MLVAERLNCHLVFQKASNSMFNFLKFTGSSGEASAWQRTVTTEHLVHKYRGYPPILGYKNLGPVDITDFKM